jgi:hypothetical protein
MPIITYDCHIIIVQATGVCEHGKYLHPSSIHARPYVINPLSLIDKALKM